MKLLLDTCVWGGAVKILEASGHNVVWAGQWSEDPGDEEILAIAHNEDRIPLHSFATSMAIPGSSNTKPSR